MGLLKDWGALAAVLIAGAGGIYIFAQLETKVNQLDTAALQRAISEVESYVEEGKAEIRRIIEDNQVDSLIVETNSNGTDFVRRISVFTYNYGDGYIPGQEHEPMYFHIRTPDIKQNSEMWRYDLRGYAYGAVVPLDIAWVGYFYDGAEKPNYIVNGKIANRSVGTTPDFAVSQYTGSDGHLYLKFGPINRYYINFTLDYQSGRTGELTVHKQDGFTVKVRKDGGNY